MLRESCYLILCLVLSGAIYSGAAQARKTVAPAAIQYKLLATSKTSTMEKEINEAAAAGFRLESANGGKTAFGGSETVAVMSKTADAANGRFQYKLLATSKTSTMQKELQQAGDAGYEYKTQTVFNTAFGGDEVVVILEKDTTIKTPIRYEYKLLATSKTGTMGKELNEAGTEGYSFVGITVSKTTFGGSEVVSILRRKAE